MRILHTADVHLQEDDSKTVESLDIILDKADEEDVDLLTIGGDLFDTNEDADALRPKLRDMLTDHDFDILVIPGNHDEKAFTENTDFGGDVDPIIEEPLGEREYEDVVVRGVPFKSSMTEKLYSEMKDNSEKKSVLLGHCTLEAE